MSGVIDRIKSLFAGGKTCPQEEKCLELARIMLDDESTTEEQAYVEQHIHECSKCYENYEIEKAVREVVKNKVENKEVPSEVVEEILSKIGS
jgi:mycothiol system anti-sigma-R factor